MELTCTSEERLSRHSGHGKEGANIRKFCFNSFISLLIVIKIKEVNKKDKKELGILLSQRNKVECAKRELKSRRSRFVVTTSVRQAKPQCFWANQSLPFCCNCTELQSNCTALIQTRFK